MSGLASRDLLTTPVRLVGCWIPLLHSPRDAWRPVLAVAQPIFSLLVEFNYPGWQSVGTSTPYRSRKGSTLIF